MRYQTREGIRRAVPLILAIVMVISVFTAAVGSATAVAADKVTVEPGTTITINSAGSSLTVIPFSVSYHGDSSVEVTRIRTVGIYGNDGNYSDCFIYDEVSSAGSFILSSDSSTKDIGGAAGIGVKANSEWAPAAGAYKMLVEVEFLEDGPLKTSSNTIPFIVKESIKKRSMISAIADDDGSDATGESTSGRGLLAVQGSRPSFRHSDGDVSWSFNLRNNSSGGTSIDIDGLISVTPSNSNVVIFENEITYKGSTICVFSVSDGQDVAVNIPMNIDPEITRGTYWVDFVFSTTDNKEEKVRAYFTISSQKSNREDNSGGNITVPGDDVKDPKEKVKISVANTPASCNAGDTIDMTVYLDYASSSLYEDLSFVTVTSDGFDVVESMETKNLKTDGVKGSSHTRRVDFKLQAKNDIKSGRYPISIKVDYVLEDDNTESSASNRYSVYVFGKNDDGTGTGSDVATPYLIVNQYDYGGEDIVAGQTFTLNFSVLNTSRTVPVENIKVTVAPEYSQDAPTLAATSSSNTFYIDSLPVKGSVEQSIQLQAKKNSKPGSAMVTVSFTYQYYSNGTLQPEKTVSEQIAIPVIQEDRLEVGELEPPMQVWVGMTDMISLSFVNKGSTEVRNISAEITGNIANPGQRQYIGNLESGSENSADFEISAMEPGEVSGTVILTYEDSNGTEKTVEKEFKITAMEMEMPSYMEDTGMMDPGMMDEPGGGIPLWVWVVSGIGVVAVGAVVAVIIIKKRRKAKQEMEDETL